MDSSIMDEILEELSSTLQRAEAQSAAILDLLRAKGIAKEDELAPYLERANDASSVRWRATRVRLAHLLSGLEKQKRQAEEERTAWTEHGRPTHQPEKERQGEKSGEASTPKAAGVQPPEMQVSEKTQDHEQSSNPDQSSRKEKGGAEGKDPRAA